MSDEDWLQAYVGQVVVAEVGDGYTVFGTLQAADRAVMRFNEADLHDQSQANSTADIYAIETCDLGVRANRRHLAIPRRRLIAISRLSEIIRT